MIRFKKGDIIRRFDGFYRIISMRLNTVKIVKLNLFKKKKLIIHYNILHRDFNLIWWSRLRVWLKLNIQRKYKKRFNKKR